MRPLYNQRFNVDPALDLRLATITIPLLCAFDFSIERRVSDFAIFRVEAILRGQLPCVFSHCFFALDVSAGPCSSIRQS